MLFPLTLLTSFHFLGYQNKDSKTRAIKNILQKSSEGEKTGEGREEKLKSRKKRRGRR
jgi:hypothetical protein